MYRILIVEDDPVIAAALERQLAQWGWEARPVDDFRRVVECFEAYAPHLVLLDISLPFCNGYHWCAELRKRSRAPIIFLSSAGDDLNLVMAINLGADDFVAKPFSMEVLTAKIRALLRRSYDFGADVSCLSCGGATLRLGDGVLLWQGRTLELTKNEAQIRALWEREDFIDDNTLTVNVTRLRRKLERIGLSGLIVTKKGEGYLVQAEPC